MPSRDKYLINMLLGCFMEPPVYYYQFFFLFYNFGEQQSGFVEPSSVEMVLVNVVIVSLGPSVASCFFNLEITKIFQTRKAKFTETKKQKHTASTIKNGVNSKIKVN